MASQTELKTRIILRNDTAINWNTANPVLLKGEFGLETDTGLFKFGNGIKTWKEIPYNVAPDYMVESLFATNEKAYFGYVDKAIDADTAAVLSGPLPADQVTGLGTAAALDVGTSAGNIPIIGEDGKLNESIIPAVAITNTHPVENEAGMLALDAQTGDIAVRADISKSFILAKEPPTDLKNWIELKTPDSKVQSVNGKEGAVVLSTEDIAEGGNNRYFTDARADERVNLILESNTFLINGGRALNE